MKVEHENIVKTLYAQPKGSKQCGPYSIAHFTDTTIKEVISIFQVLGLKKALANGTVTRDIWKVLNWMGYETRQHCLLLQPGVTLPDKCLLQIRWISPGNEDHGAGHWVMYHRGFIVCSGPSRAGVYSYKDYFKDRSGVCVGYLPVKKKEL